MVSVIASLLAALLKSIRPETVKTAVDALLNVIEASVEKSPNKYDDMIVLPLCATVRAALSIPDTVK